MRLIITIYFGVLLLCLSCVEQRHPNECLKDFLVYQNVKDSPALTIKNKQALDNCKYEIILLNSLVDGKYQIEGLMWFNNDAFYIELVDPLSSSIKLFDLNHEINKTKNVNIELADINGLVNKRDISVILEAKYQTKNLEEIVFKYRIRNLFKYEGDEFDIVYFITKSSGVIGSYISKINDKGIEIIIQPAGNILENQIDYSKTERGVFM